MRIPLVTTSNGFVFRRNAINDWVIVFDGTGQGHELFDEIYRDIQGTKDLPNLVYLTAHNRSFAIYSTDAGLTWLFPADWATKTPPYFDDPYYPGRMHGIGFTRNRDNGGKAWGIERPYGSAQEGTDNKAYSSQDHTAKFYAERFNWTTVTEQAPPHKALWLSDGLMWWTNRFGLPVEQPELPQCYVNAGVSYGGTPAGISGGFSANQLRDVPVGETVAVMFDTFGGQGWGSTPGTPNTSLVIPFTCDDPTDGWGINADIGFSYSSGGNPTPGSVEADLLVNGSMVATHTVALLPMALGHDHFHLDDGVTGVLRMALEAGDTISVEVRNTSNDVLITLNHFDTYSMGANIFLPNIPLNPNDPDPNLYKVAYDGSQFAAYPILPENKTDRPLQGWYGVDRLVIFDSGDDESILSIDITDKDNPIATVEVSLGANEDVQHVQPVTTNVIIAVTYNDVDWPTILGSIWRSDDGGITWDRVVGPTDHLGPGPDEYVNRYSAVAVDFDDPNHIWVAHRAPYIFHSADQGLTWEEETIDLSQLTPYGADIPQEWAAITTAGGVFQGLQRVNADTSLEWSKVNGF